MFSAWHALDAFLQLYSCLNDSIRRIFCIIHEADIYCRASTLIDAITESNSSKVEGFFISSADGLIRSWSKFYCSFESVQGHRKHFVMNLQIVKLSKGPCKPTIMHILVVATLNV